MGMERKLILHDIIILWIFNQLPQFIKLYQIWWTFNTFRRGKMIKILKVYGIPDYAIEDTVPCIEAKVITSDGDTDEFAILAGVLQVNTICSLLCSKNLPSYTTTHMLRIH